MNKYTTYINEQVDGHERAMAEAAAFVYARGDKLSPVQKTRLLSIMTPLKAQKTVWRSLILKPAQIKAIKSGLPVPADFMSTSQSSAVAARFQKKETKGYALLEISLPAGALALDMVAEKLTAAVGEQEILVAGPGHLEYVSGEFPEVKMTFKKGA